MTVGHGVWPNSLAVGVANGRCEGDAVPHRDVVQPFVHGLVARRGRSRSPGSGRVRVRRRPACAVRSCHRASCSAAGAEVPDDQRPQRVGDTGIGRGGDRLPRRKRVMRSPGCAPVSHASSIEPSSCSVIAGPEAVARAEAGPMPPQTAATKASTAIQPDVLSAKIADPHRSRPTRVLSDMTAAPWRQRFVPVVRATW